MANNISAQRPEDSLKYTIRDKIGRFFNRKCVFTAHFEARVPAAVLLLLNIGINHLSCFGRT